MVRGSDTKPLRSVNSLSDAQLERLALLAEEMGEALQIVGKIQRHGYESKNPMEPSGLANASLLEIELGHVLHAIDLLCSKGDVSRILMEGARDDKERSVKRWLHHQ